MNQTHAHVFIFSLVTLLFTAYNYYLPTSINNAYQALSNGLGNVLNVQLASPYYNLPIALGFGVIYGLLIVYGILAITTMLHVKGGRVR